MLNLHKVSQFKVDSNLIRKAVKVIMTFALEHVGPQPRKVSDQGVVFTEQPSCFPSNLKMKQRLFAFQTAGKGHAG